MVETIEGDPINTAVVHLAPDSWLRETFRMLEEKLDQNTERDEAAHQGLQERLDEVHKEIKRLQEPIAMMLMIGKFIRYLFWTAAGAGGITWMIKQWYAWFPSH